MFSPHLLNQFVADGVDFGLHTLLAFRVVLVVNGRVDTQNVVQGAVVSHSLNVFYTGLRKGNNDLVLKIIQFLTFLF